MQAWKSQNLCLLLLAGVLIFASMPLHAAERPTIARIDQLKGEAQIRAANGKRFAAEDGIRVGIGDLIKTRKDSTLLLWLDDGSIFTVAPQSTLIVDQFRHKPGETVDMQARFLSGGFQFRSGPGLEGETNRSIRMDSITAEVDDDSILAVMDRNSTVVLLDGETTLNAGPLNTDSLNTGRGIQKLDKRNQAVSIDSVGNFAEPMVLDEDSVRAIGDEIGIALTLPEAEKTPPPAKTDRPMQLRCTVQYGTVLCS